MRPDGFADLLDRASSELLRMEEENRLPQGLQVDLPPGSSLAVM